MLSSDLAQTLRSLPSFGALDAHVCWEIVTMGLAFPHIWAKGFDSFAQGLFAKLLWVREQMCFCTRVIKSFLLFLGHSRVIRKCLFWVRGWTGFLVGIWIISRAEVESSRFGCSLLTTQGLPEFLMCDTDPQCHRPTWPRSASGTVMNIKLITVACCAVRHKLSTSFGLVVSSLVKMMEAGQTHLAASVVADVRNCLSPWQRGCQL